MLTNLVIRMLKHLKMCLFWITLWMVRAAYNFLESYSDPFPKIPGVKLVREEDCTPVNKEQQIPPGSGAEEAVNFNTKPIIDGNRPHPPPPTVERITKHTNEGKREPEITLEKVDPLCPGCDVTMIITNYSSERGIFYGCPQWPKCSSGFSCYRTFNTGEPGPSLFVKKQKEVYGTEEWEKIDKLRMKGTKPFS